MINKKLKTLLVGIILSYVLMAQPVFAFYGKDLETVNNILLKQELLNQAINSKIIEDQVIEKLITSIDIKKNVSEEKENAYDKAVNQLKLWVAAFAGICILILIFFGIWDGKRLKDRRKELSEELTTRKKELEDLYTKNVSILKQEHELQEELNKVKRKDEIITFKAELRSEIDKEIKNIRTENKVEIDEYIKRQEKDTMCSKINSTEDESGLENITKQKEIDF